MCHMVISLVLSYETYPLYGKNKYRNCENKCPKPEMELGYYPYSYTTVKTFNNRIIINLQFWCRFIGAFFLFSLFPLFRLSFGFAQDRCRMFTCWCRCLSS